MTPAKPRLIIGTWQPHRQPTGDDDDIIYLNHRDYSVRRGWWIVHLPPKAFKILALALSAENLTYDVLDDALYCDDPDGGPNHTAKIRRVYLCKLGKYTRPMGISITTRWGVGLEARIV